MRQSKGGKWRILDYMMDRVGQPIHRDDIREASGGQSEWARRVRELRDEEKYDIVTEDEDSSVPKDHYLLRSPNRTGKPEKRSISKKLRSQVLERDGHSCIRCGIGAGEISPVSGKKAVLHIGHINDKWKGGKETLDNLQTECAECNTGASNVLSAPLEFKDLLAHAKKASRDGKEAMLRWLIDWAPQKAISYLRSVFPELDRFCRDNDPRTWRRNDT